MYLQGNGGPIVVNGGFVLTGSSRAASEVTVNGGASPIFNGALISSSLPTQILDVLSNPTTPMVINGVKFKYAPSAWTNAGKSNYLVVRVGGQDLNGMKFADLGACDSNAQGTSRWVTDADPAANPPTTCTSAGIKTVPGRIAIIQARGSVRRKSESCIAKSFEKLPERGRRESPSAMVAFRNGDA